jgi:hypothetical protein
MVWRPLNEVNFLPHRPLNEVNELACEVRIVFICRLECQIQSEARDFLLVSDLAFGRQTGHILMPEVVTVAGAKAMLRFEP